MQIIGVYMHSTSPDPDPGLHAWNRVKAFIGGLHSRWRIIKKIKHAGCTVTIEAAMLLSPRCLVTTKKADVVLGMILKQLFVLTICLEKDDVSSGICYFYAQSQTHHTRHKCDGKLGPSIVRISDAKILLSLESSNKSCDRCWSRWWGCNVNTNCHLSATLRNALLVQEDSIHK